MPKATTESIQALLAPYGLRLTLADGQLGIRECIGSGLPPKTVTLVFVAKMKPDGSVGRGPPDGYSLQAEMGICDDHYKILMDIAWLILQRTNSINTKKSLKQQVDGSIDLCIRKLLKVHPELQAYKPFGNWAPRAVFQLLLRNKSGQANSAAKRMEKTAALIASGGEPPKPTIKPRKPRGRPRKNPAPTPEGTTTTTNEPTVPIQPPLEPGPIAAAPCDDDGEVFDLNIGDLDDMDISIRKAIEDLSVISLNADDPGDDEGDGEDDGGSFDMAQVATIPASAPAPNTVRVPVPTAPVVPSAPPVSAPPVSVSPFPGPSTAPARSSVPPMFAAPAGPSVPPVSVPPAPAASATPSLPPVSVSPVIAASATPPVHTAPLASSPDSAPASIIWRGLTISSDEMNKLKKTAARRAAGGKDRFAKIYEELIGKLIEDPNYDPSSEPDPVPPVAAKKAAPRPKPKAKPAPASMSEPGLELNPKAGKGKGKAATEATDAPVRRSGRESKQTKRSIEAEVTHLKKQQDRNMGSRIIESNKDKEDVIQRYRRIEVLFRQLQSDVSVRAWKTTDKQFKTSLLRDLLPTDEAVYNSSYSMTIKRCGCTAETREKVQADLHDWVRDPNGAKVYWMNGMAGTGKTTIAYSLCEWLETNQQLGASFFCSRISSPCRNISQIIPTIAYQLAQYSPPFRSALCKALEEKMNAGKLNVVWQFKKLVEAPLKNVKAAMPEGVVVVIDALDECEDVYAVRMMLEILLKLAEDLPIKFFVTSRPEAWISDKMLSPAGYIPSVLHLHDIEESIVEEDIKKYLTESLSSMPSPPSPTAIEILAKRAGKLFIYAATAVRYILPDDMRVNSSARLKAMLATSSQPTQTPMPSVKYKELDALYTAILTSAFNPERLDGEELHVMQLVLRTVVCAMEPMASQTLASLLGITNEEVSSALQPLRSVLHVSESGGQVSALHASFPDFILDQARSKAFFCDRAEHNKLLAHQCFAIMKEELQFNICKLETSSMFDEDLVDIGERIKIYISAALFYACRYWGGHLQLGGASEELRNKLIDLLTHGLLFWMEVLNLKECTTMGPEILLQTQHWLSTFDATADTMGLAADAHAFVTRFAASACKRSTPHIYISMLPFCPRSSSVYKNWWGRTRGLMDVKGAAITHREKAALVTWLTDSRVRTAAFSSDGTRIVSGSDDGAVRVWDARTSDLVIGPLKGHTDMVLSVSFSPNGTRLVSASQDCTIRVWDARTGNVVGGPFTEHTGIVWSVAFSPDSTRIVSSSGDRTIRLWDAQTGENITKPLEGHKGDVRSVTFSRDGNHIISGSSDQTIRVWDSHTSDIIAGPFHGHTDKILSVVYSPDGTRFVSGSDDRTVTVWDVHTGNVCRSFEGHMGGVNSVAFSPEGSRIVSGSDDSTIRVWDIHSGNSLPALLEGHADVVHSVAFSPDGTRLVSGSLDRTIRVWDARPTHIASGGFQGHKNTVHSASFSPDGAQIVSSSGDRTIRLWDSCTGDPVADPFKGHTGTVYSVAFSPDGTRIVTGSDDSTIRVWDVRTGDTVIGPLRGHSGAVGSVAFSPDGTHIASSSADRTILVWDARTGDKLAGPLKGHTKMVRSVAFSPDGTHIVSGSYDHTLRTWDIRTGDLVAGPFEGHEGDVNSVAFSPDGAVIASGSDDHTVRVWSPRTGTASAEPFRGHTNWVHSVAFSPDGTLIVSGSEDCTLRLWNAHTGDTIGGPFHGHIDEICSVAFSPDGKRVVSGSGDYAIRVWDVRTSQAAEKRGGYVKLVHSGMNRPASVSTRVVHHTDNNPNDVLPDSTKQSQIQSALMGSGDFICHNDGWVVTDGVPLLWIPPDFRRQLPYPNNPLVIGPQGSTYIDYRNLMIGERWTECYVSE